MPPSLVWSALGAAFAAALWFAWSIYGAFALLVLTGGAFVRARRSGLQGAWAALVVCGVLMASVLGWAAVTGSRCPGPGERVQVRENKPGVTCEDLRASYVAMAVLFAAFAGAGIVWGTGRAGPSPVAEPEPDSPAPSSR